ncbi:MAG TPA: hypothetical protein VGX72_02440 [Solirubrobacteraceae bacterium]|nr:hypothetical protein [Solirubrobacteraceae bacterium]
METPAHTHNIVRRGAPQRRQRPAGPSRLCPVMSPTWIWMQIAIVVFVVIGMIVAIVKLA